MTSGERWKQAQAAESEFWSGISTLSIQQGLDSYESAAALLGTWLKGEVASPALEIGVGGLGVGLLGFLPTVTFRIGIDPLPLVQPACNEQLLDRVLSLRKPVQFVMASGEHLPFGNGWAGLVICENVLDHVRDAPQVLNEIIRVLRPGGELFLIVDTFSYLGLAKWHLWTKRKRANEIMVLAHPYRFLERDVAKLCRAAGFEILQRVPRKTLDRLMGHSFRSTFLVRKPHSKS